MIASPTSLSNPFNGAITVTANAAGISSPNDSFVVDFAGLPAEACVVLTTKDYGRSLYTLSINGSSVYNSDTSTTLPTASVVAAQCTGNNTDVNWVFRN
jgi:hypothetical protein